MAGNQAGYADVLNWFRSRSNTGRTASALYGSIVAQARDCAFYADGGVPDTTEGRFGMIGVHMFLVLERLRTEGRAGQELGRALLETMMTDIDDSLREIGFSDLAVPRRVKKAAAALHEQLAAYRAAAAGASGDALASLLAHHVYLDRETGAPERLAAYMAASARHLEQQPLTRLANGEVTFPAFGSCGA